mmetsp:Transcript_111122/g.346293  ORF Transcript_111122/g.346293 Transcript_111122/m.346293 type:complete len:205 (+) Transcript_111122:1566-2180(+)
MHIMNATKNMSRIAVVVATIRTASASQVLTSKKSDTCVPVFVGKMCPVSWYPSLKRSPNSSLPSLEPPAFASFPAPPLPPRSSSAALPTSWSPSASSSSSPTACDWSAAPVVSFSVEFTSFSRVSTRFSRVSMRSLTILVSPCRFADVTRSDMGSASMSGSTGSVSSFARSPSVENLPAAFEVWLAAPRPSRTWTKLPEGRRLQ